MAMSDKEICEWVVKAFKPMLKKVTLKSRAGDTKAADDFMKILIARNAVLRKFDLMVDEDGNVVPFVPWAPGGELSKFLKSVEEKN